MQIIQTALFLALPCGACVLNQPQSTTDVALDTGSETTQISGPDASSGSSSGSTSSGSTSSGADESGSSGSTSGGQAPCGNGMIDPGEDCDGDPGKTCSAVPDTDYNGGQLGCTADCRFDTIACERCEAPRPLKPCDMNSQDPFNAIELDCDLNADPSWDETNSVPLSARDFPDGDPTAFRVWNTYGNSKPWTPRAGSRALIVSTGTLAPVDAQGALSMGPGHMNPGVDNANPNDTDALYGITSKPGGAYPFDRCDGEGDCSNSLQEQWNADKKAVDVFYLEFQTIVPAGTHGYELDLAFFTAHYPVFKDFPKSNDVAIIWSQSELYVGPINYLHNGDQVRSMSLTALVAADLIKYDGGKDPEMSGTGFDGKDTPGGATPWLTAAGPALPGESITIAISIFDTNDFLYDSAMLVDNFRWSCAGCDLKTDCGLRLTE